MRMGYCRDGFVDVIEDHHAVVESKTQIGQMAIVGRRLGEPFDIAHGVVAGIADGAAAKARQTRQVGAVEGREFLFEQL